MPIRMPSKNQEDYLAIARLVAPGDAAAWLSRHMNASCPGLFLDRASETLLPTRAQLRSKLEAVEDAVACLLVALEPSALRNFLGAAPNDPLPDLRRLEKELCEIVFRSERARNSQALATQSGATRAGAGRAVPTEAISPKVYCAILIGEAWKLVQNEWPSSKNRNAQAAAQALWRAADGDARDFGEEPNARWRYHFERARRAKDEPLRSEIRRHLAEWKRSWEYLRAGK